MLSWLLITTALLVGVYGVDEGNVLDVLESRSPIHVRLCPRSQWDQHQHQYLPARVVATMSVRICTEYDVENDTCTQEHTSWSTAVSRNEYIPHKIRQFSEITLERYGGDVPHLWEIYHTADNLTYTEECLTERYFWPVPEIPNNLHDSDDKLIRMAQVWAMTHPDKHLVMRWDYGRLWIVPEEHWNAGERALHTGYGMETSTQTDSFYDNNDLRPTYYILDGDSSGGSKRSAGLKPTDSPKTNSSRRSSMTI